MTYSSRMKPSLTPSGAPSMSGTGIPCSPASMTKRKGASYWSCSVCIRMISSAMGGWTVMSFPAIAEEDEEYIVETVFGSERFRRKCGEALHPQRESLEDLASIRRQMGEYNFSAQYQQMPVPLGGGLIKREWFR